MGIINSGLVGITVSYICKSEDTFCLISLSNVSIISPPDGSTMVSFMFWIRLRI